METKEISIKLMVDSKTNKLVFAESSNDFVDLLFFLLSLPIATVINLLTTESMALGSFGNLYTSFSTLTQTHLLPNIHKDIHLNPKIITSATNIPMLISPSSIIPLSIYTCLQPKCKRFNTVVSGVIHCVYYCVYCGKIGTKQEVSIINGCDVVTAVITPTNDPKGYVKEGLSYMICDDLTVKPMSMSLIISMMGNSSVLKIYLKEMVVKVGAKEMLQLLKASFHSTTVLTDVFLGLTVKLEIS